MPVFPFPSDFRSGLYVNDFSTEGVERSYIFALVKRNASIIELIALNFNLVTIIPKTSIPALAEDEFWKSFGNYGEHVKSLEILKKLL